jgi:hypothetical protein
VPIEQSDLERETSTRPPPLQQRTTTTATTIPTHHQKQYNVESLFLFVIFLGILNNGFGFVWLLENLEQKKQSEAIFSGEQWVL